MSIINRIPPFQVHRIHLETLLQYFPDRWVLPTCSGISRYRNYSTPKPPQSGNLLLTSSSWRHAPMTPKKWCSAALHPLYSPSQPWVHSLIPSHTNHPSKYDFFWLVLPYNMTVIWLLHWNHCCNVNNQQNLTIPSAWNPSSHPFTTFIKSLGPSHLFWHLQIQR